MRLNGWGFEPLAGCQTGSVASGWQLVARWSGPPGRLMDG